MCNAECWLCAFFCGFHFAFSCKQSSILPLIIIYAHVCCRLFLSLLNSTTIGPSREGSEGRGGGNGSGRRQARPTVSARVALNQIVWLSNMQLAVPKQRQHFRLHSKRICSRISQEYFSSLKSKKILRRKRTKKPGLSEKMYISVSQKPFKLFLQLKIKQFKV